MKKIKTAVVGVGALGRHHLRWYSKIAESELVGLYDIEPRRAEQYSEEYNITAFDSLDDLCKSAEAVSIVTPTTTHCEITSTLIKKGIHCLIEKPIAANNEEATEILKLANSQDVKITVGHIERFNPAVEALQEIDIQPSFIEAHRLAAFDPRGTDVAVVLDLMIHDVDLVLNFIKSELSDIQASAVAVISEQADIANARLTFKNGAVANLTASRISLSAMRKLRIFQKSGYCSLDLAKKQADFYSLADGKNDSSGARIPLGKSGKEIIYLKKPDTGKDMLESELSSFLNCIIEDSPVAVTVSEGARSLEVALEIKRIGYESIQRMLKN